jgi:hypothetical protein
VVSFISCSLGNIESTYVISINNQIVFISKFVFFKKKEQRTSNTVNISIVLAKA